MPARDPLAPLRHAAGETALVFDVDGVLAPIVVRPELAAVPETVRAELERLAATYRLVACVSGRPGDEAAQLVGARGVEVVGNHGLELVADPVRLEAEIARFRDDVGLPVEDKRLSLAYHFREEPDEEAARARLEEVAARARAHGLVARWGRKVLEIRPDIAVDKGTAVRTLVERAGATRALYAGDDTTDLDAFRGLREARLEVAVRVAVASPEGPAELAAAADVVLESAEDVLPLLASL